MRITIKTKNFKFEAKLYDNKTAKAIYDKLPLKSVAQMWGDEIYFEIPVHVELDKSAKEVVEKGDLGFWPSGDCFCIFFGKTPASRGNEIRPASAVNIFGKTKEDASNLRKVHDGEEIIVEKK